MTRRYLAAFAVLAPLLLQADPLDGLPALIDLYATVCLVVGIIGVLIPIMTRLRRALVLVWSVVCMLVSFTALDTRDNWSMELWYFGPRFCFAVGIVLFFAFFLSLAVHQLKSKTDKTSSD